MVKCLKLEKTVKSNYKDIRKTRWRPDIRPPPNGIRVNRRRHFVKTFSRDPRYSPIRMAMRRNAFPSTSLSARMFGRMPRERENYPAMACAFLRHRARPGKAEKSEKSTSCGVATGVFINSVFDLCCAI